MVLLDSMVVFVRIRTYYIPARGHCETVAAGFSLRNRAPQAEACGYSAKAFHNPEYIVPQPDSGLQRSGR
jgi:hypothetical protein